MPGNQGAGSSETAEWLSLPGERAEAVALMTLHAAKGLELLKKKAVSHRETAFSLLRGRRHPPLR